MCRYCTKILTRVVTSKVHNSSLHNIVQSKIFQGLIIMLYLHIRSRNKHFKRRYTCRVNSSSHAIALRARFVIVPIWLTFFICTVKACACAKPQVTHAAPSALNVIVT